jgi:hypothetical protein
MYTMLNSARFPENTLESRLSYLYARRAIVDDLIRSLELYEELAKELPRKKGPASEAGAEEPIWTRLLAS